MESATIEIDKAAEQLAARIGACCPKLAKVATAELVQDWSKETRRDVAKVLDQPPEEVDAIPKRVVEALGKTASVALAFAALRRSRDSLKRREDAVVDAESRVAELAEELAELHCERDSIREQIKEKEKEHNAAVLVMRRCIKDQEVGQNILPLSGDSVPAPKAPGAPVVDSADETPIDRLGLGKRITDGMLEADIKTVGNLIRFISTDEWWHRKIKGVGEAGIDKVIDALTAWRNANPVEGDEEE